MALYNHIGLDYDRTRRADPYLLSRLRALLGLEAGATCLDVACGTGNYTTGLAAAGLVMTGVDIAQRMISVAAAKAQAGQALVLADGASLPLRERSHDGAVCTLALHHFPGLVPVFTEVRRVLRGGRFVLFTSAPEQTRGMWLRHYFPTLIERAAMQMPAIASIDAALLTAGFGAIAHERYEVRPDLQDLFLYSGKHRPERYLDPQVRAGISSFATAAPDEVDAGLRRLEGDIATGEIENVIRSARHTDGDYLFVTAGIA